MAAKGAEVVITGAGGFLGSEVFRQAEQSGLSVRGLDRVVPSQLRAWWSVCDLRNSDVIREQLCGAEAVVHVAGLAHVQRHDVHTRRELWDANVNTCETVARAALAAGVRRFVLVSSVAVYGDHGPGPVAESAPCRPRTAYAVSKCQGERAVANVFEGSGMALVILRMATVFGECDPGNVGRLVRAIDGRRFIWIGRGENNKSLIHREDAARACLLALQAATPGAATFNVASVVTTMRTIVQTIAANLGRTVPRWHVPAQPLLGAARLLVSMRVGGSRANGLVLALNTWLANEVFDGTAFRQWCGFSPSVSLEVGLHRQVKWYQAVRGGS